MATSTESVHAAIAQVTATIARLMTELETVNKKLAIYLQEKHAICGIRRGPEKAARGKGDGSEAGARDGDS